MILYIYLYLKFGMAVIIYLLIRSLNNYWEEMKEIESLKRRFTGFDTILTALFFIFFISLAFIGIDLYVLDTKCT